MIRLFNLRRLLSRFEQQRLMNEYDSMCISQMKNNMEPGELLEYETGTGESGNEWLGVILISRIQHVKKLEAIIKDEQKIDRWVIGTYCSHVFEECKVLFPTAHRILFKTYAKDLENLEFFLLLQQFDQIKSYKYMTVYDIHINSHMDMDDIKRYLDQTKGIILPHQMILMKERIKKKTSSHYTVEDKTYYVSSWDTCFEMDTTKPYYYHVNAPLKYIVIPDIFVCLTDTFVKINIQNYVFNSGQSLFYSMIGTSKCFLLTSPKQYYIDRQTLRS
jgi:hypothetical protein